MKIIRTLIHFQLLFISALTFGQELTNQFDYSPKTNFNDEIVDSKTLDNGSSFEKVVIDGFDSKIPFYLIKPKEQKENKYVFILHGGGSSKEDIIYPTNNYSILKDSLLTKGFSIVIPDAKYHGERSYQGNFKPPSTFLTSKDYNMVNDFYCTAVKDIRIMMDYIESSSGNSSATFYVVGHSMGGMITILLNAVEDRLREVIVWIAPLDTQKIAMTRGMTKDNAEKLAGVSPSNYAVLQKAPISMFMGTKDKFYTKEEAQDFFNKINIKDKSLKLYETGHYLPDDFISDTIKSIENN